MSTAKKDHSLGKTEPNPLSEKNLQFFFKPLVKVKKEILKIIEWLWIGTFVVAMRRVI